MHKTNHALLTPHSPDYVSWPKTTQYPHAMVPNKWQTNPYVFHRHYAPTHDSTNNYVPSPIVNHIIPRHILNVLWI